MSDEEYEYGSDAEEYNYSDEEGGKEGDSNDDLIAIENAFYEGDDCRNDEPAKACDMFMKVVRLETEKGAEVKWRFKALEHLVILRHRLGDYEAMVSHYKDMLKYAPTVTRNECGDSVNAVLEAISGADVALGGVPCDSVTLAKMYEVTFDALKAANNERLWFNTNVKVGKIYLASREFSRVGRIVLELHASCKLPDGTDDAAKGTSLLEVYALEIQLCTATGDSARMKAIYPRTLNLNAAVADPRIMGVIREEGGKMYMADGAWAAAYDEFYESFRAHQEAGSARAKDCLKYVVLANMLALSDINPFDAREAKVYQDEREIMAMKQLRTAYDANDLSGFEATLRDKRHRILDDPFIMSFIDPLRRRMREQVLLALIKPYSRVRMDFIAQKLNLKVADVEELLVDMILDARVAGSINQIEAYVQLGDGAAANSKCHDAVHKWSDTLATISASLAARIQ
ncbi:PCI domain-containing protein [Pelagophyceae sp. CCMP2097]|nr:PCI domain-containing protein [Pelagophyceae sp. CCMP2097]